MTILQAPNSHPDGDIQSPSSVDKRRLAISSDDSANPALQTSELAYEVRPEVTICGDR